MHGALPVQVEQDKVHSSRGRAVFGERALLAGVRLLHMQMLTAKICQHTHNTHFERYGVFHRA